MNANKILGNNVLENTFAKITLQITDQINLMLIISMGISVRWTWSVGLSPRDLFLLRLINLDVLLLFYKSIYPRFMAKLPPLSFILFLLLLFLVLLIFYLVIVSILYVFPSLYKDAWDLRLICILLILMTKVLKNILVLQLFVYVLLILEMLRGLVYGYFFLVEIQILIFIYLML